MFGSFKRSLSPLLVPALGFAAVLCLPLTAGAIQQPKHLRGQAELELAAPLRAAGPARSARVGAWMSPRAGARGRAFARLEAELGPRVLARFDADTGALDTLIPAGHDVPGANRSPAVAEQFALDFLGRHIDLLAPGSAPSDFQLVSDVEQNGVRSVGLVQTHAGREILGAQLSFRFKADRLIAVRSQALPDVSLLGIGGPSSAASRIDASTVQTRARRWIADDFAGGRLDRARTVGAATVEGPMILPVVHPGGGVDYHEVLAVEVELDNPRGRWRVYLDARSGAPIARRSLLHWAELQLTTWERSPLGDRVDFPGAFIEATVAGQPVTSDAAGQLAVPPGGADVSFGPDGLYLQVLDDSGPVTGIATNLGQSEIFNWDLGDEDEQLDAQLNAYVHAQIVKDYIRGVDPSFPPLDDETLVTVNIADVCNAYADGNTINFFLSGGGCNNSALIADVVYHEYGHVAHVLGIIPGVGLFDGAHSEGASDYLSATIVNDADVGRGFFADTPNPIRELDPEGFEWHWPEDTGEVHDEGRIIGGTLWDLRKALIQKYGVAEGVAKVDEIWLDGIRRAVDIPSTYLEALITNDDDGDLQNGTPDICEINQVFATHGLYQPPGASAEVSVEAHPDGSREITLNYGQAFAGCPGSRDPSGVVRFRPRAEPGEPEVSAVELSMEPVGTGLLRAVIPPQPELGVTQYQVELDWGNGSLAQRPQNAGDPWYEYFTGEVTKIWCSDFDSAPTAEGWALGGEWEWGTPQGGGGDPEAGYDGAQVLGVALNFTGLYTPSSTSIATSPSVDVSGFEVVRLQYQRWLNVEDGFWDQATIRANGEQAWENYGSNDDFFADVHHRDREWRFHDVVLTPYVDSNQQLSVSFGLESDGGLEFGGWNLDRVCIVGHGIVPGGGGSGVCGDGVVQQYEQCDDGNLSNGDGCSSGCLWEDEDEGDETGGTGETGEEAEWAPEGRGCGCTTRDEERERGWSALAVLGLLGLGLRRRRARSSK